LTNLRSMGFRVFPTNLIAKKRDRRFGVGNLKSAF
jgi:hypothetical protein